MGQAFQRIQEVSGDFAEFGVDGPVFVVDHPAEYLNTTHIEELLSYGVAHSYHECCYDLHLVWTFVQLQG